MGHFLFSMEIMNARYWRDTDEDPDRSRRRQAEFLVHQYFPWSLITEVGVMDANISTKVQRELAEVGWSTRVYVRPDWYY